MAKRLIDVVASGLLLLLIAPLLLAIAVAVAVTMGWPVIFTQVRPGKNERPFRIYKFRTMGSAALPDGTPLPDSQRLNPLGRFLRATSLDELPELFNVLMGHMSLVGPRPLLMAYLPYYTARERLRHSVRPGITGWAQVTGRNEIGWADRLAKDVWYVENWSLGLDLRVLIETVRVVLRRSGVVVDPESRMLSLDQERALAGDEAGGRPR